MLKVFTVYDSVAEAYLSPFMDVTKGAAIRSIMGLVEDPGHTFNRHSSNYTLFYLGEFDELTGRYHQLAAHEVLGNLMEFKTKLPSKDALNALSNVSPVQSDSAGSYPTQ